MCKGNARERISVVAAALAEWNPVVFTPGLARATARIAVAATKETPARERLLAKVEQSPEGCWLWRQRLDVHGYGAIMWQGESRKAHRVYYETFVGPIPAGRVLDHLCRVRHCVNPEHLEPVTQRENVRRGQGIAARHAQRTHCKNGHEFIQGSYRMTNRGRECRACKREYFIRHKDHINALRRTRSARSRAAVTGA